MKRTQLWEVLSFFIVLAVAVDLVYVHKELRRVERLSSGRETAAEGDQLLPMKAFAMSGEEVRIPANRQRLVLYMSRHCGACAKAMPNWSAMARTLGKENVLFAVPDGDTADLREMPAYLASYQLQGFPVVKLDDQVITRFNMFAVPSALLIGSDGTVRKVWRGALDQETVLRLWKSNR